MAHFVLFLMSSETKFINKVYHFTEIVTALYFVFQFAEYLTDFVFNGICIFGIGFDFFQIGKKFAVYEVCKVITG